MAHAAQPSEWDLGAGKTHNRENLAIFSSLHAEVDGIVVVPLMLIGQTEEELEAAKQKRHSRMLTLLFIAMIFASLGNKILQKLQTIPFRNYPNFVNLFTSFLYIILSFVYIIPVQRKGVSITKEQVDIPKRVFIIMGVLDSVSGILQVFAATYLNGSLLILLSQSSIPIAIILSVLLLNKRYSRLQAGGEFTLWWSLALVVSCIPMVLSSIYKEAALGQKEMDAIFLLGWITTYQFLFSIPLAFPMAAIGDPRVLPGEFFPNLWDGLKCFFGVNTVTEAGKYPDDCRPWAIVFLPLYMIFNIAYNILIVFALKFGSTTALYLALTISAAYTVSLHKVPLGNVAFALPFMPGHTPMHTTDIIGLVLICIGLAKFRFGYSEANNEANSIQNSPFMRHPLLNLGDSLSEDGYAHLSSSSVESPKETKSGEPVVDQQEEHTELVDL